MKPREIFINACGDIASQLQEYGFKSLQKGQILRKTTVNKSLTFEIYFQSSHYNNITSVRIAPHILIYSKEIAKLDQDNSNGLVFNISFSNISPKGKYWRELAGLSHRNSIDEIIHELKTYAFPVFEIFENDKEKTIEFLNNKKMLFLNKWTEQYIEFIRSQ